MSSVSASKAKRLAKKAAKGASAADEIASSLEKLNISPRTVTGVLATQALSLDIKVESFGLSFHGRELVSPTTLSLNYGRRYGLIGANGSGKSTLLRALAAREAPIPEHMDIYHLDGEADPTDLSALEAVVELGKVKAEALEAEVDKLLEEGAPSNIIDDIYARLDELDPSTFEAKAGELLHNLGFTKEMMNKATKDMSGGWRMRVALARALFVRPSILLLDEPTNHLDLEACVWLEEYLQKYDRILILISHSQDFLDGVCTNIMHLHKTKLVYYTGNYSTYVKTRAEKEANQMKEYEKQQFEIAHLNKFISSCGTYANLVKQAKSKQKILDKMEAAGLVEKVEPDAVFTFRFSDCEKLPPPVLGFTDVSFAYSGRMEEALYRDLDLAICSDSRIALVGPNGAGKSTLLKLMCGVLQATKGTITRHPHLRLGRYHQHSTDQLDLDSCAIDYLKSTFGGEVKEWRSKLGQFGITGNDQTVPIRNLSDGQRSRIVFCELAARSPNILLLDEPTNNLDIECIDSLAHAINAYQGGVVLVSHDFRLISQVANEIWLCDKKKVSIWDGDIRDYKKHLQDSVVGR
jgi:ATP-binding cassette subfamily F protein 2